MKRSPLKRKTPLRSRKPINKVNRPRRRQAYDRNYGPESEALRPLPCIVATHGVGHECEGRIQIIHVSPRKMGAAHGGWADVVQGCKRAHDDSGEERTSKREEFQRRHRINLREQADRLALEHERPMGIRGLADRWGWAHMSVRFVTATTVETDVLHLYADRGWLEYEGEGYWVPTIASSLGSYETDALRGWVTREMAREVDRRRGRGCDLGVGCDEYAACYADAHGQPSQCGRPDPVGHEALAHHIAHLLGGDFTGDPHGEHGLAWSLCEWAGWP